MNIVFAGTPPFAAAHLEYLIARGHQVTAVLTQPDRPAGRGKHLTESAVKSLARTHSLPIHQPTSLRHPDTLTLLASLAPDILVVVAYGLILPPAILRLPPLGCINVHASLLPRWRGAAPIQRAIEAGDEETGISIMQMDEGLDTGDVLMSATCRIQVEDNASTLQDKLITLGGPALSQVLSALPQHTSIRRQQDSHLATYANKITKAEARLDWNLPASLLERKTRAFNPAPVAYFEQHKEPIRVWEASCLDTNKQGVNPGTIVCAAQEGIVIQTIDGQLVLHKIQLPGKKPLPVREVLNAAHERFAPGKQLD